MVAAQVSNAVLKHNRDVALSTYRNLLRATYIAFKGKPVLHISRLLASPRPLLTILLPGDGHMLSESRKWVRHNWDQNRGSAPGSVEAEQGIKHAEATAQILKENVVQGKRESEESHNYKLNIHEHTERGDDTEFKKFRSSGKKFSDMKN